MKKSLLISVAVLVIAGAIYGYHQFNKEKIYLEKDVKCDFDAGICYDLKGKPITGRILNYENKILISDISYVNGKEDGNLKIYNNDGKLFLEGTYAQGKPHGYVKEYNEDGTLHSYDEFKNGIQHGKSIIYQANNVPVKEWYYDMGKEVNTGKVYYENGPPQLEINFTQKELKYYYPNNKIQTHAYFNDSGYHGAWTSYNKDGQITAQLEFENGKGKSGYCLNEDNQKQEFTDQDFITFVQTNKTPCDK